MQPLVTLLVLPIQFVGAAYPVQKHFRRPFYPQHLCRSQAVRQLPHLHPLVQRLFNVFSEVKCPTPLLPRLGILLPSSSSSSFLSSPSFPRPPPVRRRSLDVGVRRISALTFSSTTYLPDLHFRITSTTEQRDWTSSETSEDRVS